MSTTSEPSSPSTSTRPLSGRGMETSSASASPITRPLPAAGDKLAALDAEECKQAPAGQQPLSNKQRRAEHRAQANKTANRIAKQAALESGVAPQLVNGRSAAQMARPSKPRAQHPRLPRSRDESLAAHAVSASVKPVDPVSVRALSTLAQLRPSTPVSLRFLLAPNTTKAGVLLGHGGETINSLRALAPTTSISLLGDQTSDQRVLRVEGTIQSAEVILNALVDLLASKKGEQRLRAAHQPAPAEEEEEKQVCSGAVKSSPAAPAQRAPTHAIKIALTLLVGHRQLGAVMGAGGRVLAALREMSGASLFASSTVIAGTDERTLAIDGPVAGVRTVLLLVAGLLANAQQLPANLTQAPLQPQSELTEPSAPFFTPPTSATDTDPLTAPLRNELAAVMAQLQSMGLASANLALLGFAGFEQLRVNAIAIDQLQQRFAFLQSQLHQLQEQRRCNPLPPPSVVALANLPPAADSTPITLHVPAHLIGALLGHAGSNIMKIRSESQAQISIDLLQPDAVQPLTDECGVPLHTAAPSRNGPRRPPPARPAHAGMDEERKQDDVDVEAESTTDTRLVMISGTTEQIETASRLIATLLETSIADRGLGPRGASLLVRRI